MKTAPSLKALYEIFYSRCDTILHHSRASKELVNQEFPVSKRRRNVVATMFNYDRYLPAKLDQRGGHGRPSDLAGRICAVSFWRLTKDRRDLVGFIARTTGRKVPNKRLLMAGRLPGRVAPENLLWNLWLKGFVRWQ
jgi:hypothetical protein